MKMRDVRKKNYDIFDDAGRKKQFVVRALNYIDQLGALTGIDISDWNVIDIFKDPESDKNLIFTDKNKINELFFKALSTEKTKEKPKSNLTKDQTDKLQNVFKTMFKTKYNNLKRVVDEKMNNANNAYHNYMDYMGQARDNQEKLDATKDSTSEMIEKIDSVIADPFWELTGNIGNDYVEFKTQEIVLTHVDEGQKIDMTVPMGRFVVRAHIGHSTPHVKCYAYDSVYTDSKQKNMILSAQNALYHPHVDRAGTMCFGNMMNDYNKAIKDGDLEKVMGFCKLVLNKFYPDNPFIMLYRFRDEYQQRVKNEQALEEQTKKNESMDAGRIREISDELVGEGRSDGDGQSTSGEYGSLSRARRARPILRDEVVLRAPEPPQSYNIGASEIGGLFASSQDIALEQLRSMANQGGRVQGADQIRPPTGEESQALRDALNRYRQGE